jgi:hypothetical protein
LALASPGTQSLDTLLTQAWSRPASGQRDSLVIITPDIEGKWFTALLPLLQRGVAPTVLLLDRVSYDSTQDRSHSIATLLAEFRVSHYIIARDLLDQREARPGQGGHWEWRVYPSGHVALVSRPRDTTWKRLA